jgi:hypothetical protein
VACVAPGQRMPAGIVRKALVVATPPPPLDLPPAPPADVADASAPGTAGAAAAASAPGGAAPVERPEVDVG